MYLIKSYELTGCLPSYLGIVHQLISPRATSMHLGIVSVFIQIIARRLFDTKPLPNQMQGYY